MPAPVTDLYKLLGKTKLVVLPEDYFLVRLPVETKPIPVEWQRPAATQFGALIREPHEITLIVGRRKWLRMQNIFDDFDVSEPMKVITFDIKLSLNVYGYIAAISQVLAEAKISVVPMSSFSRDHILVSKKDLPRSVRLLRHFLQECRNARS